ncbi:hypothetical protein [Amycolatopsis sp. NBC_00438]|uniref:hypothetical protein n=1 Tax=Amycolatopsis sp. NBC_00438 TaxID=2903558 RepID=UPI002E1B9CD9
MLTHWGLDRLHVMVRDYCGAVSLRVHLVHGMPYASWLLADVVAIPPSGLPFFRLVRSAGGLRAGRACRQVGGRAAGRPGWSSGQRAGCVRGRRVAG